MLAEKKRGGGGKGDLFGWSIYACAYTMYAREHVGSRYLRGRVKARLSEVGSGCVDSAIAIAQTTDEC